MTPEPREEAKEVMENLARDYFMQWGVIDTLPILNEEQEELAVRWLGDLLCTAHARGREEVWMKFMALYPDLRQLVQGFRQEAESWSEWDRGVNDRLMVLGQEGDAAIRALSGPHAEGPAPGEGEKK